MTKDEPADDQINHSLISSGLTRALDSLAGALHMTRLSTISAQSSGADQTANSCSIIACCATFCWCLQMGLVTNDVARQNKDEQQRLGQVAG